MPNFLPELQFSLLGPGAARTQGTPSPIDPTLQLGGKALSETGDCVAKFDGSSSCLCHDTTRSTPKIAPEPPAEPHPPEQHGGPDVARLAEPGRSPHSYQNLPVTLETLPAELRTQILSYIVDLSDLRSVVYGSPLLYQQYLLDRHRLLGQALRTTLGSAIVDAYAVRKSTSLFSLSYDVRQRRSKHAVSHVIDEYVELRSEDLDGVLGRCSIEDLDDMALFYLTVVQPVLLQTPSLFLNNLGHRPDFNIQTWTASERVRVLRALYRFQLFHHLFGVESPDSDSRFEQPEVLALFFDIFQPWEIEETNCIDHLVRAKYDRVFGDIKWDVSEGNPRFRERTDSLTPKGAFNLDDEYNRDLLLGGTVGQGLTLYSKVLRTVMHEELVKLMQKNMTPALGHTIPQILARTNQQLRNQIHPSDRALKEARLDKLPFSGDKEDGPPLAWVTVWKGTYSNRFGDDVVPAALHAWGYVFWDAKRLVLSRWKQALEFAWASKWHGHDPRWY